MTSEKKIDCEDSSGASVNFIIPVYKPVGPSSFDVIRYLKRALSLPRDIKIGHFGTLDPFAEGLMLVGFGRFLKLINYVHDYCPKTYQATGQFGVESPTGDWTGLTPEQLKQAPSYTTHSYAKAQLQEVCQSMLGEYWQSVPLYSAAKIEGVPLHQLARSKDQEFLDLKGEKLKEKLSEKVLRKIYEWQIDEVNFLQTGATIGQIKSVRFFTRVSTGTYLRVLFSDLANKLGEVGHLSQLKRIAIGPITLNQSSCFAIPANLELADGKLKIGQWIEHLKPYAISPMELLPLPALHFDEMETKKLGYGQTLAGPGPLSWKDFPRMEGAPANPKVSKENEVCHFWALGPKGQWLGLGELRQDGSRKLVWHHL